MTRLWHRLGSPRWFHDITGPWMTAFGVAGVLLLLTGTLWGLGFAPPDYQQGNSFRIIYLHVPAAILSQSVYLFLGTSGVLFLVWRMKLADVALEAAVPFGMSMAALALITGGVWGKPTWGAWWVWDARTTSTLVLFFLYFGLYALRQSIPRAEAAGRACAVLAIVGVINIPIIKYSVDWWLTLHQTSTFKLTERPAMPAAMWGPLLVNVLGFYALFGYLLLGRMRLLILRREERTRWVQEHLQARAVA
ncbi:MAG: heme ABC transporter permease [Pseudomonadota bacterium]